MTDLAPLPQPLPAPAAPRSGPETGLATRTRTRRPMLLRPLVALARHVWSSPATFGYLLALTVTTAVLASLDRRAAGSLILHASTNLHQLIRTPVKVTVASAFWLADGFGELAHWAILFVAVVAPVERRIGTLRAAVAFVAGHVGATVLSQGLTAAAIAGGVVSRALADAPDVGVSYGFAAVAAVLAGLVPRRWRALYLAGLVAWLIWVSHFSGALFTTVGHVSAVLIGLAIGPALRRHLPAHPRPAEVAATPARG